MSRASEIIQFIEGLDASALRLPAGISLVNPYLFNKQALEITRQFYQKYYADEDRRVLILGINPGRFGAGMTGIPFTDPKRLVSACGLPYVGKVTHEPSSSLIYDMIGQYGGVEKFYKAFYINSLFPLTVVKNDLNGKIRNYNYYDDRELLNTLKASIVENIERQSAIAGSKTICICLGAGRNSDILQKLNDHYGFFSKIISIEHPRFIVQYKNKERQAYIEKYLRIWGIIV